MSARALTGRLAALALVCVACAPRAPLPAEDLAQRLDLAVAEAEFGAPFELTVTRIWSKDLEPAPWSAPAWGELRLRERGVERREDAQRILEARRFEARAFTLASELRLELPAWSALAAGGGPARVAPAQSRSLRVLPAVAASAPGPLELPQELDEPERTTVIPALLMAAALVALWALLRARRRRAAAVAAAPAAAGPDARAVALRRLADLRAAEAGDAAQDRAFHEDVCALLREFLAADGLPSAPARTSEELLTALRRRAGVRHLPSVFAACDRAKFGRARSAAHERARLLDAVARFLEEPS